MAAVVHKKLQVPQSGCGDIRITADSVTVRVEYEYREEKQDLIGTLIFGDVAAHRFTSEAHIAGYIEGSYDTLVVVSPSTWLEERPNRGDPTVRRHFAVFLSNNGLLEALASDVEELPARPGLLEDE